MDRGHDLAVVGGEPEEMQRLLHPAVRWAPGASFTEALRSLAGGGRRDVVHSHISKADFAALAAAPLTGGRRFATRHLTAPRGHGRAAQALAPVVRRGLTAEIAVSEFVARTVRPPSDTVLLNGVRPQDEVTAPRRREVLMAHRLAPEKDTPTGLRAFATSGLGDRGWQLVVAGRGDDRAALERQAADLGIGGSTRFVGWLTEPAAAFRSSSVFLAPAPDEPCSLSILEAMSHGLPVVAAASGGNPETVGSVVGSRLFPVGDDAAAGEHLRQLAEDDAAREAYGDALRTAQRVRFALRGHVADLVGVYEGRTARST
ncbi:glycosyltransferase family 4 protein [Klenkia sp. PcliD-1-E]|nr:glycosyltransferase family 4 protein [Klenkia sp. PcliD-1-E]